jgi:hypothetical protein
MSNPGNTGAAALAIASAKTPGISAALRRQAARAYCSGYYGTSRSAAIEATLKYQQDQFSPMYLNFSGTYYE